MAYYYGLFRAKKGQIGKILCRESRLRNVLKNIVEQNAALIVLRESTLQSADVEKKLDRLFIKYNKSEINKKNHFEFKNKEMLNKFKQQTSNKNGHIGLFIDDVGEHTAIVLQYDDFNAKMIFVTSNPRWNHKSRQITNDEEILLGVPNKGKISYFAPVIRPGTLFTSRGFTFPQYRVDDLIKEFFYD